MRRLLLVGLLLSLLGAPPLARADEPLPIASVTVGGNGVWAAFRLSVSQPDAAYEVTAVERDLSARTYWGAWLLTDDEAITVVSSLDAPGFLSVEGGLSRRAGPNVSFRTDPAGSGTVGFGGVLPDEDVTLVVMLAHDEEVGTGTLGLSASPSVQLQQMNSGDEVFLATERDFHGDVMVAGPPGWARLVDVRDAHYDFAVFDRMFGAFAGFIPDQATGSMSLTAAEPSHEWADALDGPGLVARDYLDASSGRYRFQIAQEQGAGVFGPAVWAAGADVRLPNTA